MDYSTKKYLVAIFFTFLPCTVSATTDLPVPFTSQAPFFDWREPWQNACEETSILMVDKYYAKKTLDKNSARDDILNILKIKEQYYGQSLDENAEQIALLINNFLPWEAYLVAKPTLEQIKSELDSGRPIILPLYGKALLNPYFRSGGPDYHVNVISGYDDEKEEFIVQEPGTRRGLDFRYPYDRLLGAIHDYLPLKQTAKGEKIAIFTRPEILESASFDTDEDGLIKSEELTHGTSLTKADTDNDGYSDLVEIQDGYLPTLAEKSLPSGSLIKLADDPKIFLLEKTNIRHIATEKIFVQHGWQWDKIIVVSEKFFESLTQQEPITS
jgi:hypothetical protein